MLYPFTSTLSPFNNNANTLSLLNNNNNNASTLSPLNNFSFKEIKS
jgi:hypothetical protein